MTETLSIHIKTPISVLLTVADVTAVNVQLSDGGLTIWPGHAPLLAATVDAPLHYRDVQGEHTISLAGGILQIKDGTVTIFTQGWLDVAEIQQTQTRDAGHYQRLMESLIMQLGS